MLDWLLSNLEAVEGFIIFVLAVVSFIVTLFVKHSVKKSISNFKEVLNMSEKPTYRTVFTRVAPSQSFSETVPDYRLNPDTNELEELPLPRNIQAKIDSFVESALDRALKRFQPEVSATVDDVAERLDNSTLDLSSMAEAMEIAEQYREQLNLPDNYSMSDIYGAVNKYSSELKNKLSSLRQPSSNPVSGGDNNGKA